MQKGAFFKGLTEWAWMAELAFISEKNRERYLKIIEPVGNFFARAGIHPDVLSISGLLLSILASILYGAGFFFWAAWVVVLAGSFDVLDGEVARRTHRDCRFGAFLDSTLDRYSDTLFLIGLAYYFAGGQFFTETSIKEIEVDTSPWTVVVIFLAMAGSYMVSYSRARAEGIGIECKSGLMQRPERMVLLIIGSLLGSIPGIGILLMKCTLLILAVSTNITAMYRIWFVRNRLEEEH